MSDKPIASSLLRQEGPQQEQRPRDILGDILGEMSMQAFREEHANDPQVDPHAMVRFSQLDMDATTKPLHVEIERLQARIVVLEGSIDYLRNVIDHPVTQEKTTTP